VRLFYLTFQRDRIDLVVQEAMDASRIFDRYKSWARKTATTSVKLLI
jgi:hypothetical protein